jgi:NADPH2:quinone reductase
MKAVRVHEFGSPSVLQVEEVATPHPEAGQVLVRVHAAGVNPVDTYIRSGVYAAKPSLPYTPGSDGAGVVEAVGDAITRFAPGDRVYLSGTITGTYAEFALCWEHQLHKLAERVSFAQGAGVNVPFATAYRALFWKAHALPAETVLIHGASGGVGTAAVQLARAHGMVVIGTAGSERGRELVQAEGADHALDHHAADYLEQLMALTHGKGVDVILEMLANVNLAKDLTVLAKGGRVVVIGNRGTVEINPRDAMARDASILGMVLFNGSEKELASIHAALVAGLANGSLRPVVGQELPLAEAPRAHEAVMEGGAHGKIILTP